MLIWEGQPIVTVDGLRHTSEPGGQIAFTAVVSDMVGMVDATTQQVIDISGGEATHLLTATITYLLARRVIGVRKVTFPVPTGAGALDLDRAIAAGTVEGVPIVVADQWSEVVDQAITDARVDGDWLVLTRHDGTEITAGHVRGPEGDFVPVITDDTAEWWVHPQATVLQRPVPRIVKGGLRADGTVIVSEVTDARVRTVEVGTATQDDHNVPAVWARDGHRTVVAWTNHGQTSPGGDPPRYMHLRVSDRDGTLSSLRTDAAVPVVINFTGGATVGVSYAQLHHIAHLSTVDAAGNPLVDHFWVLTRYGNTGIGFSWRVARFTVDQVTGEVTVLGIQVLFTSEFLQLYVTSADAHGTGDQVIRLACAYNPNTLSNMTLLYFELNCVTGAITSPHAPTTGNVLTGAGLPIDTRTVPRLIPNLPDITTHSRRLSYVSPGPFPPRIAIAEWDNTTPNQAMQKIVTVSAGVAFTRDRLDLSSTGTSYAAAAFHPDFQTTTPSVRVWLAAPIGTPGATRTLVRRTSTDGNNRSWQLQLLTDRRLQVQCSATGVNFTGGGVQSTLVLPADAVGYGLDIHAPDDIRLYYTLDGDTWVQLGATLTGIAPLASSIAPLEIGSSTTGASATQSISRYEYRSVPDGTLIASQMTAGRWQDPDPQGRTWTNTATLIPGTDADTAPRVTDIGIAGPRIGYVATSNYVPMPAFCDPAVDDTVITAQSTGTTETVKILRRTDLGPYREQTMMTQPTTAGRLFRPIVPTGGNVDQALVVNVTHYSPSNYEQWAASVRPIT
ncbi:hypothetical protein [Microbacterium sp. No. 7]|uniref:hypothetical protein n=1 Tax=Microbacterium sp. No. 7 TaxID=1714373 RepID=UPI0018CFF342|nr:hypothetical protein [Microbacterium sp. No. 7]